MSSYSPNPTAAAQPAVTVRRSRRRIGILALLAIGTMINYLDRTVLGIAAPKLTAELGIDPAIMGILFSAFAYRLPYTAEVTSEIPMLIAKYNTTFLITNP